MCVRAKILLVAAICSCSAQKATERPPACVTWREDIQSALAPCVRCHADLADYDGAIARRDLLASVTDPATADETHRPFTGLHDELATWVGTCQVQLFRDPIHQPGILDPSSGDFHGALLKSQGWNFNGCAKCHEDGSAPKCTTCHADGPTSCGTCHGQPPPTGAHLPHIANGVRCQTCHPVPDTYAAAGHLDGTVQVTQPYDKTSQRCSGVACHGGTFADANATNPSPKWTGGPQEVACGTCHGTPPENHHGASPCSLCHEGSHHMDGRVDVAVSGCTSCHGQPPATGAHAAHMNAPDGIAAPIACATCHTVPSDLLAPKHVTGPLLAFSGFSSSTIFDGGTKTCSGWCHGTQSPPWDGAPGAIFCGSCHGIPPASHDPSETLSSCASCHAKTVDAYGWILPGGAHLNGVVDVE